MKRRSSKGVRHTGWYLIALLACFGYIYLSILRPLSPIEPTVLKETVSSNQTQSKLSWPQAGQSSATVVGEQNLTTHGVQSPVPMASTAKIITALVVLDKKPLTKGQTGPTITLTKDDEELYKRYQAMDGSILPVKAGEQLTEYQMLQAIMLPSANNIADTLAIWSYGSLKNYSTAANNFVKKHRLTSTHVGSDASGLAPDSVSTARDLTVLGVMAMQDPVLSEIVNQPSASGFPLAGTIKNVNTLLGTDGIVGVKTGNSDQAGGAYVTASKTKLEGRPVTIVGSVAGSASLFSAMKGGLELIRSAQHNFSSITVVTKNERLVVYRLPWGGSVEAVADRSLNTLVWNGSTRTAKVKAKSLHTDAKSGDDVGVVYIDKNSYSTKTSSKLVIRSTPSKPSILWRLTHPLQ